MKRKKELVACVLIALFLSVKYANAGLIGSAVGALVGGSISSHNKCNGERIEKVNDYLWSMHQRGKYAEDYSFFLEYLEQSEDIRHLNTVAQVYNDNGDHKKAIKIYEKRILPWLSIENERIAREYKELYEKLKNQK
jgi:tetratricopeptide (TPR) repeat protein